MSYAEKTRALPDFEHVGGLSVMTDTTTMLAARHRRPTSHRAPDTTPTWKVITRTLVAVLVALTFLLGLIGWAAVVVAL